MGFVIGLHNEAFDTQNLGPYQTVTMNGLNAYFIRDGQSMKEYFGYIDSQDKLIINLPEVNEKNLTKGTVLLSQLRSCRLSQKT